jgi:5-deoxy-glucuronate isomerase
MSALAQTQVEKMVFRKTHAHAGRHITVTPANSTNRHLSYGRIILRGETRSVSFKTNSQETGLIVLAGAAAVSAGGQDLVLGQYDGLYLPRGSQVRIDAAESADIAELSAPVKNQYPLQVVRRAEASQNPSLTFTAGAPGQQRQVNIVFGKNVEAGRLVAGFTVSEPGNWTSWPPHEHAAMLEEMYVYFDMPEPAFGLQLVYNDTEYPELVTPVRDGDAVLMPAGYHPNVAVPGHRINFLWAMAAHREKEDRQFGVVNVQPSFAGKGSGLEASRK